MIFKPRRGSSLVFLGFSIVIFVISYGIMFMVATAVLGTFFSTEISIADTSWQAVATSTEARIQWLLPLIPTIGIFIVIIKVLMVASTRGRD